MLLSCTNKKENIIQEDVSPGNKYFKNYINNELTNKLSNKIVMQGDSIAYLELKDIYFLSGHQKEFLYYSMVMAEKFNYPDGYYTTYFLLSTTVINDKNWKINKIANYYLIKANEAGHTNVASNLKERFKNKIIPKSNDFWLEINK